MSGSRQYTSTLGTVVLSWLLLALSTACTGQHLYRPIDSVYPVRPALPVSPTMAIVEFDDQGFLMDGSRSQLNKATRLLKDDERERLVLIFVHGWKHNASPEDEHLRAFSRTLMRLQRKEAVFRPDAPRPVVGIYLAWRGKSTSVAPLSFLTYWGRNETAVRIGAGPAMAETLETIIGAAREKNEKTRVILVGHSMGALILQEALHSYLPRVRESPEKCKFEITAGKPIGHPIPDLTLFLNSATSSLSSVGIIDYLTRCGITKTAGATETFTAPLFISLTSEDDDATGWLYGWARTLAFRKGGLESKTGDSPFPYSQRKYFRTTDGHNEDLMTHDLQAITTDLGRCNTVGAKADEDEFPELRRYCLGRVTVRDANLESVPIALPREKSPGPGPIHDWYALTRRPNARNKSLFWIVRVPHKIIASHGDIFNERALQLSIALGDLFAATVTELEEYKYLLDSMQAAQPPESLD